MLLRSIRSHLLLIKKSYLCLNYTLGLVLKCDHLNILNMQQTAIAGTAGRFLDLHLYKGSLKNLR